MNRSCARAGKLIRSIASAKNPNKRIDNFFKAILLFGRELGQKNSADSIEIGSNCHARTSFTLAGCCRRLLLRPANLSSLPELAYRQAYSHRISCLFGISETVRQCSQSLIAV